MSLFFVANERQRGCVFAVDFYVQSHQVVLSVPEE